MNGYAVARKIRQVPALSGAFIVALTGYAQPGDKERALSAGFDTHLAKPADPAMLQEVLCSAVQVMSKAEEQ